MDPALIKADDVQHFQDEVAAELRDLQRRPEETSGLGLFGSSQAPITPPDRRERERLERLGRQARQARHEPTRERVAREQERPWLEQDRWGLRKRVWQERRDRDRAVLELREQALLQWEQQLATQLKQHAHWLRELQELEPEAQAWCAEQAQRIAHEEVPPELWEELCARRKTASLRRAHELLAQPELRTALGNLPPTADVYALARAITPCLLKALADRTLTLPRLPILFAALAVTLSKDI